MNCSNCKKEVNGKYCSNCGQKTETHRFSMHHFIEHDIIHGALHLDKGFPYTIKKLMTRPGHSIRAYVQGERKPYFHFITLLLLLLTIDIFLEGFTKTSMINLLLDAPKSNLNEAQKVGAELQKDMMSFIYKNQKLVNFSLVPIYALLSLWIFRGARQNYLEHVVLTFYKVSGGIIVSFLLMAARIITPDMNILKPIYWIMFSLSLIYTFWFVYQYFSGFDYSKKKLIWKSFLYMVSEFLFLTIIGMIVALVYGILKGAGKI